MAIHQDPTDPTGISDDSPRGSSLARTARDRKADAALQHRRNGASWDQIAVELGYPDGERAQVATELALQRRLNNPESLEFMRAVISERLEMLTRSAMRKATDEKHPEHLAAIREVRGIAGDFRKLHGLDAPQQHVITNPSLHAIMAWVDKVSTIGTPLPAEGDIFGLDVVDAEVVREEGPDAVPTG